MSDIFSRISSNTLSANGNQTYITDNIPDGIAEGYVFIKVFRGGKFNYRFIYSGIIDSTFGTGEVSRCNCLCDWSIDSLHVAVSERVSFDSAEYKQVLFRGGESVYVGSEKYVVSDAVELSAGKGSYVCLKIRFSGKKIPCHKESIIPVYRVLNGEPVLCPEVPVPVFTGIDYEPVKRVAFLGDSITQGIGSTFDSYLNFAAVSAEAIGEKYSYWNLGLGYGRASDAASNGIWLEKAKTNDVVVVCYGVNDIFKEDNADKLKKDLFTIVSELKKNGVRVLVQTVPPFNYDEHHEKIWRESNAYIRDEIIRMADGIFDSVPVLSLNGENMPASGYGPHPNDEGCSKWAEKLVPEILKLL